MCSYSRNVGVSNFDELDFLLPTKMNLISFSDQIQLILIKIKKFHIFLSWLFIDFSLSWMRFHENNNNFKTLFTPLCILIFYSTVKFSSQLSYPSFETMQLRTASCSSKMEQEHIMVKLITYFHDFWIYESTKKITKFSLFCISSRQKFLLR